MEDIEGDDKGKKVLFNKYPEVEVYPKGRSLFHASDM